MLTLSLISASLVAVAALLATITRTAPAVRISGGGGQDRGITLQTLIVTAVLVLMAVAAGVVIVAITRNAQENVERAGNNSIDARCNEVEVYNAQLAAAGVRGTNLGGDVMGSAIGCIPACALVFPDTFGGTQAELANFKFELNANLTPEEAVVMQIDEEYSEAITDPSKDFLSGLDNIYNNPYNPVNDSEVPGHAFLFVTPTAVRVYLDFDYMPDSGVRIFPRSDRNPYEIFQDNALKRYINSDVVGVMVAPNQKQCNAYDATGKIVPLFNY